jgi:hypothetical protein
MTRYLAKGKPRSSPIKCILFASLEWLSVIVRLFLSPEIDYVKVLNRILPRDIRVLGWCPVPADFHARLAMLYVFVLFFLLARINALFCKQAYMIYLLTSVNSKEIKCSIVLWSDYYVQLYDDVTLSCFFSLPLLFCRFTCLSREYKYLFWKGDLDILVLTLPLIFILAQWDKTCPCLLSYQLSFASRKCRKLHPNSLENTTLGIFVRWMQQMWVTTGGTLQNLLFLHVTEG